MTRDSLADAILDTVAAIVIGVVLVCALQVRQTYRECRQWQLSSAYCAGVFFR